MRECLLRVSDMCVICRLLPVSLTKMGVVKAEISVFIEQVQQCYLLISQCRALFIRICFLTGVKRHLYVG